MMALSKQGSLHEKHITLFHAKHEDTEILIFALILLLASKVRTPNSQALTQSSQKVQPLLSKERYGVLSSAIFIISTSQTVAHLPSHLLHSL